MGLFEPDQEPQRIVLRTDTEDELSSFSDYSFFLDDHDWPTVEHYFQAMKFNEPHAQEMIRSAKTPKAARKLGRSNRKKLRKDWRKVRVTVMTRAVYIKCKTYPTIAASLLATEEGLIQENSNYDYFWGCGRDRRGENSYGKVLMNVRQRLQEEAKA